MNEELRPWQKKVFFTVEMLRWGDRENHSYVIGVFDNEFDALKEAWLHMRYRAGKYDAHVTGWEINDGVQTYNRDLKSDHWQVFAQCCPEMAEKLKPILDADEDTVASESTPDAQQNDVKGD